MKRIYSFIGALTVAATALGVPARPGLRPYIQPDGSVVMVTRSGDEYSHYLIDASGRILTEDSEGRLVEAEVPAGPSPLAMRRAARQGRSVMTLSDGRFNPGLCETSFPANGERRALVVLVEYQDVRFNVEDPHAFFDSMLNEEGFSQYGGTGSARDFFIENSMGQFRPVFDVYGPILLDNKRQYYGANNTWGEDRRPEEMAIEACRQIDDEVDFNDYDIDGDGFIDNVFVFYADTGEATDGPMASVWPHSADISDLRDEIFTFDGVRLNHYACTNETVIYNGEPRPDGIGTFVHEFSHVIGLPDLYTTVYNNAFTPGEWSTLDTGPYNNEGRTPPYYSAYERFALGWMEPEPLTEGEHILEPVNESNRAFFVPTDRTNEYFLIESRRRQGYDTFIPGHGLLVWHVDYNSKAWHDNTVNNVNSHQRVDIIEADGKLNGATRNGDTFPGASGVTSFGEATSPAFNSWSGKWTGWNLSEITELSEGTVQFLVSGMGLPGGVGSMEGPSSWSLAQSEVTAGASICLYDLQGRRLAALDAGQTWSGERGQMIVIVSQEGARKVTL